MLAQERQMRVTTVRLLHLLMQCPETQLPFDGTYD